MAKSLTGSEVRSDVRGSKRERKRDVMCLLEERRNGFARIKTKMPETKRLRFSCQAEKFSHSYFELIFNLPAAPQAPTAFDAAAEIKKKKKKKRRRRRT